MEGYRRFKFKAGRSRRDLKAALRAILFLWSEASVLAGQAGRRVLMREPFALRGA